MRILIVVHGFPPGALGGTELYAAAQARELASRYGDDVLVLAREADHARPDYLPRNQSSDGVRVVRVNNTFRSVRRFAETYANPAIDAVAAQVVDDFRPDVAHIHHLTCLSTGIVAMLAARRVPVHYTLHDYWLMCHRGQLLDVDYRVCGGPGAAVCRACLGPAVGAGQGAFALGRALRTFERWMPAPVARRLRPFALGAVLAASRRSTADDEARARTEHMRRLCAMVARFIAPSRAIRDRFVAFGVDPGRITLAEYGIDRSACAASRGPRSDRLRLGFIGSLMVSKAPHVLLEAYRLLPPGSASVDLFGGVAAYHGDDRYGRQLAPLAAQPGVRMHGAWPHERVGEALASMDVLVVPSIWPENSPFVIREAFAAGVPVVASNIGGIPEIVTHGVNGLLVAPGSAGDLARALRRLLDEPDLVDRLRRGIRPPRSIEEDVQSTRALYEEILA